MALWGAEVKPGQELVHSFSKSNGRLRITRATLGSQGYLGWSNLEARVGHETRATLCTLHPITKPMCGMEVELEEDKDVTFSVNGQNSIHLSGYFMHAKAPTYTAATRPTLSKGTHQEMPDRNRSSKKSRREDGSTCHDSDDHDGSDQERNDGNKETNDTPPPPIRNKKTVRVVKRPSGTTTSNINHKKSGSVVHDISDDEKETTSTAKEGAMLKTETITKGRPDAKMATVGSKVRVKFVGCLSNGEMFDEEESYTFKLGSGKMIRGWDLGITGMLVGEKRRLTIPPSQGYGDVEQEKIPPNSWLIYTVKLLEVEQAKRTTKGSMHEKRN